MSEIKTNKISSLDSSNSDITIEPDGTGDTIVASGNVGIGTSSPVVQMHVKGSVSANNAELRLEEVNGDVAQLISLGDEFRIGTVAANPVTFRTGNTERMRIDSSGRVGIGITSPTASRLHLYGSEAVAVVRNSSVTNGTNRTQISFQTNAGTEVGKIQSNTSSTTYATSSDHRLKENVADMTGAIDRVKALAPKRFNFIVDADTTVDGFLAHEAQAVVPEAITGTHNEVDEDGNPIMQGIDQSKLVPLLTAALKESIAKIEALETENSTQATQIADLITRVTALENA